MQFAKQRVRGMYLAAMLIIRLLHTALLKEQGAAIYGC